MLSGYIVHGIRRIGSQAPYFVPPFAIGVYVFFLLMFAHALCRFRICRLPLGKGTGPLQQLQGWSYCRNEGSWRTWRASLRAYILRLPSSLEFDLFIPGKPQVTLEANHVYVNPNHLAGVKLSSLKPRCHNSYP